MKIKIFEEASSLAVQAANDLLGVIIKKPNALICFASGDSPKLTCELFVQMVKEKKIDISRCSFIELDEWVGVPPEVKGSCHYDFIHRLAGPLQLSKDQFHLFNGLARDLHAECDLMDEFIQSRGGRMDAMIVGVGMNGHIGFNEPEVDIDLKSHVIQLDKTTLEVSKKYFDQPVHLTKGITLGLAYLIEAIRVILIATGSKKADVIKHAVDGPITTSFPASIIQIHPEGYVFVDKEAGALLNPTHL